jgi:hypothetical protein
LRTRVCVFPNIYRGENGRDYVFKLLFSSFDNIWVMLEAKLSMLECLSHSSSSSSSLGQSI